MTRLVIASLVLATWAQAAEVQDNEASIQQKVDSLDSKRGLEVGGTIRSVFAHSLFTSKQDVNSLNVTPDQEREEFTQFDLKLGFRPFSDTRANAVIRMAASMQTYFENAAKTVSVPWLNVEGKKGQVFHWVAGDFREEYTPLTLWSPNVDIMYEPTIFKRNRDMARDQVFLQGNQRTLEGINLQYRDGFGEALSEVRAEGLFTRLRRVGFLDASGATGNLLPNESLAGASQSAGMNKYAAAANEEAFAFKKNVMFGATQMAIWDDASSLVRGLTLNQGYVAAGGTDATLMHTYGPLNPFDTLPQHTSIFSFRAGADIAGLADMKGWTLNVSAEYALDNDKIYNNSYTQVYTRVVDSLATALNGGVAVYKNSEIDSVLTDYAGVAYDTVRNALPVTNKILKGSALLAQLEAGYKQSSFSASLNAKYLMNDSAWFNSLAQSPSFFPRRILNSDKDGNTVKYGVNSPLYTTFDALYEFDPKFSPVATDLGNDDNHMKLGQTNSYNIAPYSKNSWTTATLNRKELEIVNSLTDPRVQLSLPNGSATANRTGAVGNLTIGILEDSPIEMQGLFSSLSEMSGTGLVGAKASFTEMGAGAKVDVFKLAGFSLPCELSGSYKTAKRTQGGGELKTDFINASIYTRFQKRFGITAGYQNIGMTLNTVAAATADGLGVGIPLVDGKQWQWMVGLDYTLSSNSWFAINYGMTNVKNTYHSTDSLTAASLENLPDYIIKNPKEWTATTNTIVHEFSLRLIEATINVAF